MARGGAVGACSLSKMFALIVAVRLAFPRRLSRGRCFLLLIQVPIVHTGSIRRFVQSVSVYAHDTIQFLTHSHKWWRRYIWRKSNVFV
jgi:hypothetical protein